MIQLEDCLKCNKKCKCESRNCGGKLAFSPINRRYSERYLNGVRTGGYHVLQRIIRHQR